MLKTYAGNEAIKKEAYMIADVLQYIVSGESEALIREVIDTWEENTEIIL